MTTLLDMKLRHNKEMTEELNANKLLMNINKEDPQEMETDKLFLT
jgi:hypothetical protein